VVIREVELVVFARKGEALDDAEAAVDTRESAAVVLDAFRNHFPAECGAGGLKPTEQRGIGRSAERVDVVNDEGAELRLRGEEAGERAVFQEVRNFEPMADG